MPKVIFEFDEHDDKDRIREVMNANNYWLCIWEFGQHMRSLDKYGDKDEVSISELREKFYEILNENGVGGDF